MLTRLPTHGPGLVMDTLGKSKISELEMAWVREMMYIEDIFLYLDYISEMVEYAMSKQFTNSSRKISKIQEKKEEKKMKKEGCDAVNN